MVRSRVERLRHTSNIGQWPDLTLSSPLDDLLQVPPDDRVGHTTKMPRSCDRLLAEFIKAAPIQFLDEITCELTGQEMYVPGIHAGSLLSPSS
ncbi:MAG: hypothetical protein C0481_15455 [Phenylobacterium sp.]|nr:hypothetical protein [Phenylobacterium sp.]